MHNSQAENEIPFRINRVTGSASVRLPSQESATPPPHEQSRQQAVPAEFLGTGTWTVSGAEEARDLSASDASRARSHSHTQYDLQAQRHLPHSSETPSNGSVGRENLLLSPTGSDSRRDSLFNTLTISIQSHRIFVSEPSSSNDSEVSSGDELYESCTDFGTTVTPVVEVQDDSTNEGVDLSQDIDADDVSSVNLANESTTSIHQEQSNPNRPYTDSLSLPGRIPTGVSPALSIISDAGHQQQLRQKQSISSKSDQQQRTSQQEDGAVLSSAVSVGLNLQGKIFHALVTKPKNPDFGFVPQEQLYQIVNADSVASQLKTDLKHTHTSEEIAKYANYVCKEPEVLRQGKKKLKSFQKIFATLVMVGMSASISHFLDEDVSDLDLPLAPIRQGGMVISLCRQDSSGNPTTPLRCFNRDLWSFGQLRSFARDQWNMLAPFFSRGENGEVKHYMLQDQHILPFVDAQMAEDDEVYGGFAKVMMVQIHPEHHNFKDKMLCDRGFAIKQLNDSDHEAFTREVNILKKFSGARSHKHIVSLLATYEQHGKFHLIFYRAGGDLFKYWKELEPHPPFHYFNVLWMAEQCAGIADGLMKLHKHITFTIRQKDIVEQNGPNPVGDRRTKVKIVDPIFHVRSDSFSNGVRVRPSSPTWWRDQSQSTSGDRTKHRDVPQNAVLIEEEKFGRHGDINPGNILWFHDSSTSGGTQKGTLKIADFGQAELNSAQSKTRPRDVANTMTYRPPECDIAPRIIRQSYDIWCLGCVYLEFVTWILGGKQLLERFNKRRSAPDRYLNNQKIDTFFEFVKNQDTAELEVGIKSSVTKACNPRTNAVSCCH
ncbi:hypothetical protein N0V83_009275 [Neocucurbitaria cava]|uniref:Protein kinase domain-containing protein n=1 Tax=Neocucurbitaria cava TaxID=798079 RepID=A0A9W9CIS3_9PLEO|nr:hypothetical protein N0V83_009275 [Neocucurbitaria cava]